MAFFDWNHDGKNDAIDDFIEYNVYKESSKNNSSQHHIGNGMSNFGAIAATIASIFIAAGIVGLFNLEGTALVIAFIIVVSIVAAVISVFFG